MSNLVGNGIALSSGEPTLSPALREFVDQMIECLKLDIVQGVAFETEALAFGSGERNANPSTVGKIVCDRIRNSLQPRSKELLSGKGQSPLSQLYNSSIRELARRHNVDLLSPKSTMRQIKPSEKFAFLAPDFATEARIADLSDNLFTHRIDGELVREDARVALANVIPGLRLDPAIIRMIMERSRLIDSVDLEKILGSSNKNQTSNNTDESQQEDEETGRERASEAPTIVLNKGLQFLLHRVKCLDETNPEWAGDDEIAAGGVATNWDETSNPIREFRVGNSFEDGTSKSYRPPLELARFDIDRAQYPANFLVMLALFEKDGGGASKFIQELWEAVKKEVKVILAAIGAVAGATIGGGIGGTVGTAIAGPLGTVIGAAAGAIVGGLVAWLSNALKDEIFFPQAAALQLRTHDSTFNAGSLSSEVMSVDFRQHGGHYRAYYSWKIVR